MNRQKRTFEDTEQEDEPASDEDKSMDPTLRGHVESLSKIITGKAKDAESPIIEQLVHYNMDQNEGNQESREEFIARYSKINILCSIRAGNSIEPTK